MSCLHHCVDEAIQSKVKRIKARQAGGGRIKREQQLVEPSVNFSGSSDIVKVSIKLDNRIVCIT